MKFFLALIVLIQITCTVASAESLNASLSILDGAKAKVAVNPITNKIYVGPNKNNDIFVIDGATNTVSGSFMLSGLLTDIAINTSTNVVYIAQIGPPGIVVVNGSVNTIVSTISASGPYSTVVGVNSMTNKIYFPDNSVGVSSKGEIKPTGFIFNVADASQNNQITTTTITPPDDIPVDSNTNMVYSGIAVDPSVNKIYIISTNKFFIIDGSVNPFSSSVTEVSTNTIKTFYNPQKVPTGPIAINTNNGTIYANFSANNVLTIVGSGGGNVIGTLLIGDDPQAKIIGIAVNPTTNKIYVITDSSNIVYVLDANKNQVTSSFKISMKPSSIAVNPTTNKIYITNDNKGLFIFDGSTTTSSSTPSLPSSSGSSTSSNDNSLKSKIKNEIDNINGILLTLRDFSKQAISIAKRITFWLDQISNLLNQDENKCKSNIVQDIEKLNSNIGLLKKKGCVTANQSNCIKSDILNRFLPAIQESFNNIKEFSETDDNSDNTPDACQKPWSLCIVAPVGYTYTITALDSENNVIGQANIVKEMRSA